MFQLSPEDFFTPYIWQVVCEGAGIGWAAHRLALFPVDAPAASDPDAAANAELPPLTHVDVDEGVHVEQEHGPR